MMDFLDLQRDFVANDFAFVKKTPFSSCPSDSPFAQRLGSLLRLLTTLQLSVSVSRRWRRVLV